MKQIRRLIAKAALLASLAFLAWGCTSVPAYKQALVSQPGMTFEDSLVDAAQSQLTSQVEPGASASGGAQASGCSACR